MPVIDSISTGLASIYLSWSVPSGSVIDRYEVAWESSQCPDDVDQGSGNDITDLTSSSYDIYDLKDGTNYTIIVTAINSAGTSSSDPESAVTSQRRE